MAQAKSEAKRVEASLAAGEAEFARTEDLVRRQSLENRVLDEVRKRRDAELASRETAVSAIGSAEADVVVAEAKRNSAQADLQAAKAETEITYRQMDELDVMIDYATLKAPFAGIVTHRSVDILPDFKKPVVVSYFSYPGLPTLDMEKSVTSRVERALTPAGKIEHQESRTVPGATVIKIFFQPGADASSAMNDIVNLEASDMFHLPPGIEWPFTVRSEPSNLPVVLAAIAGEGLSESELYSIGYYAVRNKMGGLQGVQIPHPFGGKFRQMMIYVDPAKLQSHHVSARDVVNAMQESNLVLAAGTAEIGGTDYQVHPRNTLPTTDEIEAIPVAVRDGRPIFIRDLGRVVDDAALQYNIVRVNGKRSVYCPLLREPGENTIAVVDRITEGLDDEIPKMKERGDIPEATEVTLVSDQSHYIRNAMTNLVKQVGLGALLVVVVENVIRPQRMGKTPLVAAREGTQEVSGAILAGTITTLAVFLPAVFLTGMIQDLFEPLSNIATVKRVTIPGEIAHYDISRVNDVHVNVAGRDVGSVARDVEKLLAGMDFESGVATTIRGPVETMKSGMNLLGWGLVVAAVLVYLVLMAQFRSFIDPLIIMLAVPLGLGGVLAILWLTGTNINIQSLMGTLMMIGVVVNNSILLVEFANRRRADGLSSRDAALAAAQVRLRPILMTSLTLVASMLPLSLYLAPGNEAMIPLARALLGGMLVSTVLTLVLVPCVYSLIHRRAELATA